jgi:aspartokinase/homoserine dehydrogenase 1
VVINTDVSGVMTADPRIVPEAVPVAHLTYEEAMELAV